MPVDNIASLQMQDQLLQDKLLAVSQLVEQQRQDGTLPINNGWVPETSLGFCVYLAGFWYDPGDDIVFSLVDSFTKNFGFCRMYDRAAVIMSMVIDSEPISFNFDGYEWMIELWKGQYCLEVGGEIGVYRRELGPTTPMEKINGKFYQCLKDEALFFPMAFKMMRNNKFLFKRDLEKHWWLTGFKFGEFAEPEDLEMLITIQMNNLVMANAFNNELLKKNYKTNFNNTTGAISFTFSKPTTRQPDERENLRKGAQATNFNTVQLFNHFKQVHGITKNDPNLINNKLFGSNKDCEKMIYRLVLDFYNRRTGMG